MRQADHPPALTQCARGTCLDRSAPTMIPRAPDPAYVGRIVAPAREFGFPEWYVERLDRERVSK